MFFLLSDPITNLPGIGPKMGQKFAHLGVESISDLIHYYPRKWEDFSQIQPIAKAEIGSKVTIRGSLITLSQFRPRGRRLHITTAVFSDQTGSIKASWFNQPYLTNLLKKGVVYLLSGSIREVNGQRVLSNPAFEKGDSLPVHTGRIVPIYKTTAGISSKLIRRSLNYLIPTIRKLDDTLPHPIIKEYGLQSLPYSLEHIHFPTDDKSLKSAKQRLGFEELLPIQIGLSLAKTYWENEPAPSIAIDEKFYDGFVSSLDFQLTKSQASALQEILGDLQKPYPARRLLLGDVGSGKTIVAAGAIAAAVKAGYQVAFMAPTEVLAVQHYNNLSSQLKRLGIKTTLLTGGNKPEPQDDLAPIKSDVAIGTHALIQKSVAFKKLGLVIVDEQHRFGVRQRQKLKNKADNITPHFLSLSATPIPRTFFLGLMRDLKISELTDRPQTERSVVTRLVTPKNISRVKSLISKEIDAGHVALVVVPLIEDQDQSSTLHRSSISTEARTLAKDFPKAKVAILHGRMKGEDKIATMQNVRAGKVDILLATSVIEVGIDLPEATIIWIKNADLFGLATLHQLRGRVGRSDLSSYCLIESTNSDPEVIDRLTAFAHIEDGSKLAELDLKARGPGVFFSKEQSGFAKLKLADLTDIRLIKSTRQAAEKILKLDPTLKSFPKLKQYVSLNYTDHQE